MHTEVLEYVLVNCEGARIIKVEIVQILVSLQPIELSVPSIEVSVLNGRVHV